MSGTKESDLVTAVLLYAIRCLAEGDQYSLQGMNFGPEEMDALSELSAQDLYRADSLQAHCLQIRLNRQVYWPLVSHLRDTRVSESTQQALIRAGAPLEMMQSLFGMGPREYTRYRRQMVADIAPGRPPQPDDTLSHEIYASWSKRITATETGELEPSEYLEIVEETDATMRAIWTLTERWRAYGVLDPGESVTAASA